MYFVPHFGHAKVYGTSIWTPCFQILAKAMSDGFETNFLNWNIWRRIVDWVLIDIYPSNIFWKMISDMSYQKWSYHQLSQCLIACWGLKKLFAFCNPTLKSFYSKKSLPLSCFHPPNSHSQYLFTELPSLFFSDRYRKQTIFFLGLKYISHKSCLLN